MRWSARVRSARVWWLLLLLLRFWLHHLLRLYRLDETSRIGMLFREFCFAFVESLGFLRR